MIPSGTTTGMPTWWWLLGRARGAGLVARVAAVAASVAALGAIRLAAADTVLVLDVAVLAVALVAAAVPDSHVGLALMAMVGVAWWVQVDDVASPWSMVVAGAVALLHAALAASTVAPPTARWTAAMIRRWVRRTCAVAGASVVSWLAVAWVDGGDARHGAWLAGVALAAAAGGALWTARPSEEAPPRR